MSRQKFCLYVFGPISMGYVLPLFLYELPIKIRTVGVIHEIAPVNLVKAIVACLVWFGIVIFLISYPNLFPKRKPSVRYWSEKAQWAGFLSFSVFGCFIAVLHRLFFMPAAIEQLIHQLSFMPTIGIILGLSCLQALKNKEHLILLKILVFSLLALDVLIVFALPIVFGVIAGVAISAVAILFGLSFIGIQPTTQFMALGIFALIVLGGLGIKKEIRGIMCGGAGGACERLSIKKVLEKEKKVDLAKEQDVPQDSRLPKKTHIILKILESQKVELAKKEDVPQDTQLPKTKKELDNLGSQNVKLAKKQDVPQDTQLPNIGEFLKSLESQKKGFESGFDPNFKSIRFMPSQLEDTIFYYFIARVLHRINRLGELGYIIQATGDHISYSYGLTYFPLLTKFIPRLIWSGKPQENFGQYFGHRYKFIGDENLKTSVNLPLIVEGYMNWGWFGIVFSAVLVGIVLRLLWEFWIGTVGATGNVILGMVVVMVMVLQEVNLSQLFGGLLYGGIVYMIIESLFRSLFGEKIVVSPTP